MIHNRLSPLCYCLDAAAAECSTQCSALSPTSPFSQDTKNVNAVKPEDPSAGTVHYRDSGSQIQEKHNTT